MTTSDPSDEDSTSSDSCSFDSKDPNILEALAAITSSEETNTASPSASVVPRRTSVRARQQQRTVGPESDMMHTRASSTRLTLRINTSAYAPFNRRRLPPRNQCDHPSNTTSRRPSRRPQPLRHASPYSGYGMSSRYIPPLRHPMITRQRTRTNRRRSV
jgi:hypothetical protein